MNWYSIPGNSTTPAGLRGTDADAMNGNAVMFDAVAGQIFTTGGNPDYTGGVRDWPLVPGYHDLLLAQYHRTYIAPCIIRIGSSSFSTQP